MPIRPENLKRYPPDWPQISLAIKERAGWQCECMGECGRGTHDGRCPNRHSEPAYGTGSKVVLTTAHLVSAVQLPVDLAVTGATEANEVVELVGFLVPFDPERLEWDHVVHDRALSEFLPGATAGGARFVVALPGGSTGGLPGGTVVAGVAARPVWVVLSSWRLSGPPREAADVAAESAPLSQEVPGDPVLAATAFADSGSERSLRAAYEFSATGLRASSDVVRGLLRRDRNYPAADAAFDAAFAPTLATANSRPLDTLTAFGAKPLPAPLRAGFPGVLGIVREFVSADGAGQMAGTKAGASHGSLYHFGYLPENCDQANIRAFCQGCHLHYDKAHHAETRAATRAAFLAAVMDPLFDVEARI